MILANTFREKLNAGKPTMGTHIMFTDPDIPELVGDLGLFDYGEISAEYSSLDMNNLYHQARAAQCGNLPLIIKPDQESQGFWTQAAMGAGFKGVLFTDIRTPEDVDECHRIIKPDNPEHGGMVGVKLRRPALASYDTSAYLQDLESFVFAIMIEKNIAVQNLDSILERARDKGVLVTQWGPADFGFSLGPQGRLGTDGTRKVEETVIAKSLEYGLRPRIEIGAVEQAKRYIDLGVKDFCIGWDRFILRQAFGNLGEGLAKLLQNA